MRVHTLLLLMAATVSEISMAFYCPTVALNQSQQLNGYYWLDETSQCHSRHSWVRQDGLYHLYYLFDSHDGWVVSKNDCATWGGFVATIKTPELRTWKVEGTWMEFFNGTSQSANISMNCLWNPSEEYLKSCLHRGCLLGGSCVHSKEGGFSCPEGNNSVSSGSLKLTLLLFAVLMSLTILLAIAVVVRLLRGGKSTVVYEEMPPAHQDSLRSIMTRKLKPPSTHQATGAQACNTSYVKLRAS